MHDVGLPGGLVTPNAVCEAAAQILLLNVKWLKSLDVFVSLPARDQVSIRGQNDRLCAVISSN